MNNEPIKRMKKIWTICWFFILFAFSALSHADSICSHVDLNWIHAQLASPPPDARIVHKKDLGTLCEVVISIDGKMAPAYAGTDFLIFGHMYKQRENISINTLNSLIEVAKKEKKAANRKRKNVTIKKNNFIKLDSDKLSTLVSITYQPGNSEKQIYVITDPSCSHCKALLDELEIVAAEADLALKIIIYPILGQTSLDMALHAICKSYSYEQYRNMDGKPVSAICKKAVTLVKKTDALLKPNGIRSVPVVIAQDGSWAMDGNDINSIRAYLGLESKKDSGGPGSSCEGE